MGYLGEQYHKVSKEFTDDDFYSDRSKETKHYAFTDILANLHLVNAAIAVTERGNHDKIHRSVLLSPYSIMHYSYGRGPRQSDDADYLKVTSGGKPKFVMKEMCRITKEFVEQEFKYFESVMEGLQKNNLYRAIYEHKRKGLRIY